MSLTAVLLVDLQRDFLAEKEGRMPIDPSQAAFAVQTANAVLSKAVLPTAIPIIIVNRFSPKDFFGNLFRRGAAIAGTRGAELDERIQAPEGTPVFAKSRSSAFTNAGLGAFLKAHAVTDLVVFGVMAEACVRVTVKDALRHGYSVRVVSNATGSKSRIRKNWALWDMQRAGAGIVPSLLSPPSNLR